MPDVSFVSSFWILGFVFAIACAPCDFLYLNNEYMIYKKKTLPSLLPPYLQDVHLGFNPASPGLASCDIPTSNTIQVCINQPLLLFALDIRFQDRRHTNRAPGNSEMSGAEGKVCKTPLLLVLAKNNNIPRARRRSSGLPQLQEIQSGIHGRTLTRTATCRPAEDRVQAFMKCSLYEIIGSRTHQPS